MTLTLDHLNKEIKSSQDKVSSIETQLIDSLLKEEFDSVKTRTKENVDNFRKETEKRHESNLVINISKKSLNTSQLRLLEKGLSFCPMYKFNSFQMNVDLERFYINVRLKAYFCEQTLITTQALVTKTTPINLKDLGLRVRSNFSPPKNSAPIETFITLIDREFSNFCRQVIRGDFTFRSNFHRAEYTALKTLMSDKDIVIKGADKGGAIVRMNYSFYRFEILSQLANRDVYLPLANNPTLSIRNKIVGILEGALSAQFIGKMTNKEFLTNELPIIPVFYVLPKIHKNLEKPPGRPKVASTDSILSPLLILLEKVLTPLIKETPYIRVLQDTAVDMDIQALCSSMDNLVALGLLYDEPNSVDQAEKNLLALCQGQDDVEVYCQKFRKWSVLTLWNESALAALFRKGLSEALKDVMVGFPMPAGLNESMSLAIQIGRRLRERKSVHHLAVLSESKPEPMQCDRTMTKVERQEHRRLNRLCFYCGDSTHAISNCPKRTRRFDSSAVIGTVQSKFLLSITLMCSLSSYSVMAFVDSGAALNLMDLDYAKRCGFFLEPLRCPIPLRGIDATPLAKNKPQYWAQLTMCMAPAHQEVIRFLVLHNLHDVVVLGLPWLQTHNPVLDWNSMSVTSWGCQGVHGDVPFLSISSSIPSDIPEFLSDFQDVFEESKSDALPPHRNCDCAIDLIPGSKFPKGRLFNLSVPEHTAMRSYVKESLEKGHIRPSSSPLGAGFFFVAKKDGSLRPCIDYRLLNKITVKFQYPLPLISDLFARIKGASWFTKIDLRGAYNLVRIRQGDEWKTAFNMPEGHFEYLVMPFGLANAPSVFQSFMHDIFREYLDKFLIVYLDDILIFSDDWESHVKQVRMVFPGTAC
ncbi:unnamed protein product [Ranitomeya imitator]|uniref:ribonuclease H n=1 Tax=Ranitomeya imitator TaxID=111125 RepID=A0ABN9MMC6_9NEOB|nr:unnamed protein product [Ranitomeya imitator]